MTTDFLFVYGTLRRTVAHPCADAMRDYTRERGPAWIRGRLYDFGAYPGLVDPVEAGEIVLGELYEVLNSPALYAVLDAYEECGPNFAPPTEYLRLARTVHQGAPDLPIEAQVYVYNWPIPDGLRPLPSPADYLRKSS